MFLHLQLHRRGHRDLALCHREGGSTLLGAERGACGRGLRCGREGGGDREGG